MIIYKAADIFHYLLLTTANELDEQWNSLVSVKL